MRLFNPRNVSVLSSIRSLTEKQIEKTIQFELYCVMGNEQRYRPDGLSIKMKGRLGVVSKFLKNFGFRKMKILNELNESSFFNLNDYNEYLMNIKINGPWSAYTSYGARKEIYYLNFLLFTWTNINLTTNEFNERSGLVSLLKEIESGLECEGLSTCFGKVYLNNDIVKYDINNLKEVPFLKDRMDKWLFTDAKHKVNDSEEKFYSMFDEECKKLLSKIDVTKAPSKISLYNFIKDYSLWTTTGAELHKTKIELQEATYKGNKLATALLKLPEQILREVKLRCESGEQEYKVVVKNESNTIRLIVLGDTETYILESYMSYYLEPMLNNKEIGMFSFLDEGTKASIWLTLMQALNGSDVTAAIDYKGWDEGLTARIKHIIANNIHITLEGLGLLDELDDVDLKNFLKVYAYKDYVYYRIEKEDGKVEYVKQQATNGLESGKRWTTLINSMTNKILNNMATRILREGDPFSTAKPKINLTLGDDVISVYRSMLDAQDTLMTIESMGFNINKTKTKLDTDKGEFLKIHYDRHHMSGLPLRAVRSVLFATEDEKDLTTDEKRTSRLDLWVKFLSRISNCGTLDGYQFKELDKDKILGYITSDLFNAFNRKMSIKNIKSYLNTSSIIGGGGIFIDNTAFNKHTMVIQNDYDKKITNELLAINFAYEKALVSSGTIYNKQNLINSLANSLVSEKTKNITAKLLNYTNQSDIEKVKFKGVNYNDFKHSTILLNSEIEPLPTIKISSFPGTYDNTLFNFTRSSIKFSDVKKDLDVALSNNKVGSVGLHSHIRNSDIIKLNQLHNYGLKISLIQHIINNNLVLPKPRSFDMIYGEILSSIVWNNTIYPIIISNLFINISSIYQLELFGIISEKVILRSAVYNNFDRINEEAQNYYYPMG